MTVFSKKDQNILPMRTGAQLLMLHRLSMDTFNGIAVPAHHNSTTITPRIRTPQYRDPHY
jgi:hypothetical protein